MVVSPSILLFFFTLFVTITSRPIDELPQADESIVQIENGYIRGVLLPEARAFLGIPFAAPPVNKLRFAAPQPVSNWSGVRNTTAWSAGCPQVCVLPPGTCPAVQSEDCLYLNVWTPREQTPGKRLPVMVFFPGGRFDQSGAPIYVYNSETVVNQTEVVIVVTNYRLGFLGWGYTSPDSIRGNYGLEDQHAALTWVQRNIAFFGGDPSSVTIFGESAGGTSTATLFVSKWAFNESLFHRAIIQSNPWSLGLTTPTTAVFFGQFVASYLKCSLEDLDCFRSKPVSLMVEAQQYAAKQHNRRDEMQTMYPWTPLIDGDIIKENTMDAFLNGHLPPMPAIVGTCANESVWFVSEAYPKPVPRAEFDVLVGAMFGPVTLEKLRKYYPITNDADTRPQIFLIITDFLFYCPARAAARAVAEHNEDGNSPSYFYQFDHVASFPQAWGNYTFCYNVTCHSAELPFVFDSAKDGGYTMDSQEKFLSQNMYTRWTNFAKSGTPNGPSSLPDGIHWPSFDYSNRLMRFGTPDEVTVLLRETCDFWDTVGYDHKN